MIVRQHVNLIAFKRYGKKEGFKNREQRDVHYASMQFQRKTDIHIHENVPGYDEALSLWRVVNVGSGIVAAVVVFFLFSTGIHENAVAGLRDPESPATGLNCCMELQLSTFSY